MATEAFTGGYRVTLPIAIIIPTLDEERGNATGKLAQITAGCDTRLIVVAGPRRGFTKTVNDGLRQTTAEDVCILNDDVTQFQHGWLAALHKGLYSQPNYGIAGPSGKSAAESRAGRVGMRGLQVCKHLSFWCVLIRRKTLDAVGLLDENYIHYCSDSAFCVAASKKGWKCVWVRSVYLEHTHHGSGLQSQWKLRDQHLYRSRPKRN